MLQRVLRALNTENWKRGIALVILWAYAYQLVGWPLLFWATTIVTAASGWQMPGPPVVPWEQLTAGTATLAAVGGISTWRDSIHAKAEAEALKEKLA